MPENIFNLGPGSVRDITFAFQQSRIILTAFELGIFTELDKGAKTSGEVAAALNADARAADRLMDALVSIGLLSKSENKFSNREPASDFLVKGKPGYLSGLMHTVNLWNAWSTLTESVRKGTSVIRESEKKSSNNWVEPFIEAMHFRAQKQAPMDIALIDLDGVNTVLDLGGGSGVYSIAVARASDNAKITLFDLPDVIKLSKKYVEKEKLSDRIGFLSGDYKKDNIGSGYDLIFLSAIVHSNSYEENEALVKKCADALNEGGRVIIQDFLMSEDRTEPLLGAIFSLNMLVETKAGDTFTEKEISTWMENAGLKLIARKDTASPGYSQVIGKK
jgi:predicted O-methyltransferase YrrM